MSVILNRSGQVEFACVVCGEPTRDYALVTTPWPHHLDLCAKHMTDECVAAIEAETAR